MNWRYALGLPGVLVLISGSEQRKAGAGYRVQGPDALPKGPCTVRLEFRPDASPFTFKGALKTLTVDLPKPAAN